jgi:hypothetical protein
MIVSHRFGLKSLTPFATLAASVVGASCHGIAARMAL